MDPDGTGGKGQCQIIREAGYLAYLHFGSLPAALFNETRLNAKLGYRRTLADFYDRRGRAKTFQGMLDKADKFEVPEAYAGEYAAYLQALVDSAVFTDDAVTSELATRSGSDAAAVELGISAEKDSILFYYELREMMPKPGRATIDKIIAEEKLHLRQLSDLKKALSA